MNSSPKELGTDAQEPPAEGWSPYSDFFDEAPDPAVCRAPGPPPTTPSGEAAHSPHGTAQRPATGPSKAFLDRLL